MKELTRFLLAISVSVSLTSVFTPAYSQSGVDSGKPQRVSDILHGRVVDSDGEPLPGAAVVIKNGTRGVMTDNDGYFSRFTRRLAYSNHAA